MKEILRNKIKSGDIFDVTIIDLDTHCSISYGFGYMSNLVLTEQYDEFGITMLDEIISEKKAIKNIAKLSKDDLYEVQIIDQNEDKEITALFA